MDAKNSDGAYAYNDISMLEQSDRFERSHVCSKYVLKTKALNTPANGRANIPMVRLVSTLSGFVLLYV